MAWDLAYSPGSPAIIWAARYGGLWYTNNGGTFWGSIGGYHGAATAVAVSPLNPSLVYVGSSYGQLSTWDNSASLLTDLSGNSLVGDIVTAPPSSHGGGGALSIQWLLSVLAVLGFRLAGHPPEALAARSIKRATSFGLER